MMYVDTPREVENDRGSRTDGDSCIEFPHVFLSQTRLDNGMSKKEVDKRLELCLRVSIRRQ